MTTAAEHRIRMEKEDTGEELQVSLDAISD